MGCRILDAVSMKYKVIDNFLFPKYFETIQSEILEGGNIWEYVGNVTRGDEHDFGKDSLVDFGFSHTILFDGGFSHLYPTLESFYDAVLLETRTQRIIRSRLDMVTYTPNKHKHIPHVDFFYPHIASVFYLTNTDAETVLYNEKATNEEEFYASDLSNLTEMVRIKPKENRMLIFDGSYLHTGHSPSDCKRRVLINTDLS